MSKLSRIIILLLISINFVNAVELRTDPENYWLQSKTWENSLSSSRIIESSLAASGLDSDNLKIYINKYEQLLIKFSNDTRSSLQTLSAFEQGEFILNWAHENILNNYIEEQTLMDILIDTGNYNCVSSAVFYLILSKEASLRVASSKI